MLITLLVSALAIAYNEVESAALTTSAVFNSCKPEVSWTLFDEVVSHGFVRYLDKFVVALIWRAKFVSEPDILEAFPPEWLVAQQLIDSLFKFEFDCNFHVMADLHLFNQLLLQVFNCGKQPIIEWLRVDLNRV